MSCVFPPLVRGERKALTCGVMGNQDACMGRRVTTVGRAEVRLFVTNILLDSGEHLFTNSLLSILVIPAYRSRGAGKAML